MARLTPEKASRSILLLFLLLLNLTIIVSGSRIFAMTPTTTLDALDVDPVRLDSMTVDHNGYRTVVQGSYEAHAIQEAPVSHPLGRNASLVLKLEELAIVGDSNQSGSFSTGWVLDDQLHNFSQPVTLPLNDYINIVQSVDSGNFDDDLAEELIVVGRYEEGRDDGAIYDDGRVIIYDDRAHNHTEIQRYMFAKPWCIGTSDCPSGARKCYGDCDYFHLSSDVATGDFNGDGIDEFAIVLSERDYDNPLFGDGNWDWIIDVYIYDPVEGESNYPYLEDIPQYHWSVFQDDDYINFASQPKLAAGELDGDGLDELVLTAAGIGRYQGWVFEYSNGDYSEVYDWTSDSEGHQSIYKNDMVLGDIDGDHRDEIMYLMRMEGEGEDSIWIKDDATNLFQKISRINIADQTGHDLHDDGVLGAGDVDGDGFDEVVVYSLKAGDKFGVIFDYNYSIHEFEILKQWNSSDISSYVSKELTLGDVDADGMDEIILSTGDNFLEWGGEAGTQTAVFDDATNNFTLIFTDAERKGFIATGDFDADGVQLKFTGEHWTTTAPPKPVMAIAAPPWYQGTSFNYIDTDTAIGSETSRGTQEGNSIGVTEGTHWSVGGKVELEKGIFKAEASFTFRKTVMNELLRTKTKTQTSTTALGYTVGYLHDSVIYQITEFDNYQYEITSHPVNPDAIGQLMTLDVPRETSLWKVSTAYYNERYSTIAPRIGSETFAHTVGQPWTYPNSSIIESIAPIRWRTPPQTVGLGTGYQKTSITTETISTTEMSLTHTTELSYAFEGSMGISGEIPVLDIGVSVYATAGAGWTSAYIDVRQSAISVGEKCMYEGIVGDIADNETFHQLKYQFALVVYHLDRTEEGISYQVVNYIVDGAPEYLTNAHLTCDTMPSMVTLGEHVVIRGDTNPVQPGVDVTLQQQTNNGWTELDSVSTNASGQYEYVWTPPTSGVYHVRASITGDETYNASLSIMRSVTVSPQPMSQWMILAPVLLIAVAGIVVYQWSRMRT